MESGPSSGVASGDRPTRQRRPSHWWDTINFGHEDAYSNALAYQAGVMMAELARDPVGEREILLH